MAYVNPRPFAPSIDPFEAAGRGFTMADLLRKRNFGRAMDTQARDFDITTPGGQAMLMQALSQGGYGREVADLQKSYFDPDSREKQMQYGRDATFRGLMEQMSPYGQPDPLAGLELDAVPPGRFTQPPQGRFQDPMPGQPGGTQDLRADWLKGLMGLFGGGQQGPSYGMAQAPGQGNYGTPQIPGQGSRMAPMPSQPGTDPAIGAALDRSLQGIPEVDGQTLPNQGVGTSDSARLMKEATDRFLASQQQPAEPRPGPDDDRLAWEAVRLGQMSVGDYLTRKRQLATGDGDAPATVAEWTYYNALSPEDQARFLEMKRAQKTIDLGGSHGIVGLGGQITKTVPKTLAPGELPSTRGAQAAAAAAGAESVTGAAKIAREKADREKTEAARKHQQFKMAKAGEIAGINDFVSLVDKVAANKDLYGVTGAGKGLSLLWGSDFADLHADLNKIVSSGAIETLAKLKRESPTGSTGFGALSEKELKVIQDAFSVLSDRNISAKKAREELTRISTSMRRYLSRVAEFERTSPVSPDEPAATPATPSEEDDGFDWGKYK